MGHPLKFTPEQEQEVVALYLDKKISTRELRETYSMSSGHLQRIIKRHNLPRRNPELVAPRGPRKVATVQPSSNGHVPTPPAVYADPHTGRVVVGSTAGTPTVVQPRTAVTVDKYGTVVKVDHEGPKLPEFNITAEIVTTTTFCVRAVSIEEALHRAKTDPKVRRVIGVREAQP